MGDETRGQPDGHGGRVVAHDLPEADPPAAAYICDRCNAYPAGDPRAHAGAPCPYCPGKLRRYVRAPTSEVLVDRLVLAELVDWVDLDLDALDTDHPQAIEAVIAAREALDGGDD